MAEVVDFLPRDEAEVLASHLAALREDGQFDTVHTVGIRARLGELLLTGKLSEVELAEILLEH